MSFAFTPTDGYRNTTDFPTNPPSETAFRDSMQDIPDQIRDYLNTGVLSASVNGYQKLPTGLILQWGKTSVVAGTSQTVTFPIAFPSAVYSVVTSMVAGVGDAFPGYPTNSNFPLTNSTGTTRDVFWIAIGA